MKAKFSLLFTFALLFELAASPPIIEPRESRPEVIGDLEFSLVTQTEWPMPALPRRGGGERLVTLQLRIKNSGDTPVLFPTIDTIRPRLEGPNGKRIEFVVRAEKWQGADPAAILLKPGSSYSVPLRIRMLLGHRKQGEAGKPNIQLTTARSTYTTRPILTPGQYALSIELSPSKSRIGDGGEAAGQLWSATGRTNSVKFELVPSPEANPTAVDGISDQGSDSREAVGP